MGRGFEGPQGAGMGLESFSRHAGMGRDKTIWGKDEDPILLPHPAPLPFLRKGGGGGGDNSLEMERSLKQEGVNPNHLNLIPISLFLFFNNNIKLGSYRFFE